jgi:hypothetical protein
MKAVAALAAYAGELTCGFGICDQICLSANGRLCEPLERVSCGIRREPDLAQPVLELRLETYKVFLRDAEYRPKSADGITEIHGLADGALELVRQLQARAKGLKGHQGGEILAELIGHAATEALGLFHLALNLFVLLLDGLTDAFAHALESLSHAFGGLLNLLQVLDDLREL